ncbi:MAG: hypothetical protein ACO4AJ_01535, partial [Prochlorothrix sp.]
MNLEINQFLLGTVLFPLLAALFKNEISNLYKSWTIYNARPFDADRDPNTPDRCQLHSAATILGHHVTKAVIPLGSVGR